MRLELTTSSLPRRCSTTELPGHNLICADLHLLEGRILERATGVEPATFSLEG
jgi:hypothetical protein